MPRHPVFTDALIDLALSPDAVAPPDQRAEVDRWFHQPALDALTRAPLWSPQAVYLPLVAWLAATASAPLTLPALLVGALAWTLAEYLLHRFVFHYRPTGDAGRVVTWVLHRHHHHRPQGRSRLVATPWQSASLLLPITAILTSAFPGDPHGAVIGLLLAYVAYETLHALIHHGPAWVLPGLRRHHLNHHFAERDRCFGISSPLWDGVLGTRKRKG